MLVIPVDVCITLCSLPAVPILTRHNLPACNWKSGSRLLFFYRVVIACGTFHECVEALGNPRGVPEVL